MSDKQDVRRLQLLRTAIDQHAIVSVADHTGRITYVNDRFCAVSGYRREELIGQNHRVVKSGVHPPSFYEEMWSTLALGRTWQGEICNRRKNGSLYWVASTIVPFLDDNGLPVEYVSIRTDITEIKRSQERIRLFARALEASVDGISIADAQAPDLPLIYVNPAFEAMTGYRREEVLGRNCRFLQGHDTRQEGLDGIRQALQHGRPGRALLRNYRKDSTPFWNELSIAPVRDDAGRLTHFIGVANDVTERVEAERALARSEASLHEAQRIARMGNWLWHVEDDRLDWSDETYVLYGQDRNTFRPTVERYHQLVHPDDAAQVRATQARCLETDETQVVDHRVRLPNGELRWMRVRAMRHLDEAGRIEYVAGTVQDVTEEKMHQAELEQARAAAEAASEAKSLFLSRISHELRTPMNAVLGYTQLIQMDDDTSPKVRSFADEAYNAGAHLLEMINEILDFTRIEARKIEYRIRPVRLTQSVQECLQMLTPLAQKRNIRMLSDIQGEIMLLADPLRLRQVLLNLISNACKYTHAGDGITIRAETDAEHVKVAVLDHGPGIPPEREHELFRPFHRLESLNSTVDGVGIGLSLSKLLVEGMGGTIGYNPAPGGGSCFWIRLPRAEDHAQDVATR